MGEARLIWCHETTSLMFFSWIPCFDKRVQTFKKMKSIDQTILEKGPGVWSATPTPFTVGMQVDVMAVKRMVAHHLRIGVKGLFLAGTCGEGPWMTESQKKVLLKETVKYAKGQLIIAMQVTDQSAVRILENIRRAADEGADVAVMAPPFFMLNTTNKRLRDMYLQVVRQSPLPVGIYHRGKHASVCFPSSVLAEVYMEPNVILVKDSSSDPEHMKMALKIKHKKTKLLLLNGDEFNTIPYLKAGYDGLLLGGGIFNGFLAGQIRDAVLQKNFQKAEQLQAKMNDLMFRVFGGKKIPCWLSGQKKLMVEMGVFSTWKSYLEYPLTSKCCRSIQQILKSEKEILFPSVK